MSKQLKGGRVYVVMCLAVSPLQGWSVDSLWTDEELANERKERITPSLRPTVEIKQLNKVPLADHPCGGEPIYRWPG